MTDRVQIIGIIGVILISLAALQTANSAFDRAVGETATEMIQAGTAIGGLATAGLAAIAGFLVGRSTKDG